MPTPSPGGIFAAVLTPLNADYSVNHAALVDHCHWLLANGCHGLAVMGTTGEANSFSVEERLAIVDALIDGGVPGGALMPGTGCCSIPDTVRLSAHAVENGAAGVLMLPPFYYKGVSDDGLFAAYCEVIERVGDRRLKIFLYHFPQMSATPISYGLIERLLARYPNTIAGMKDSSGDYVNMAGAARRFPGFGVMTGSDQLLSALLADGGIGCITAAANIASNLSARVYANWQSGDTGAMMDAQQKLSAVWAALRGVPLS
ncbi:MAG TPA: dihydrodipicolinate synthase family protein, partial [Rhodospirillales bacterium]|nr:dihydrodipicolinate synthase family protein [Rhodospirillales bacterium]